ncbi:MAG: methyltransferase [Oscillospiraceae bacterium]|nr:methyltransferase [Oscillospiraceae bacterium]
METLHNGFTLEIGDGCFPLSTDSIALSGFVKLPRQAKVLDLGAGCGTLGLLLCANDTGCCVTGVEIDEHAHKTALRNIDANALASRLSSICADLRTVPSLFSPGSFTVCVSNPPYFTAGPQSKLPLARREDECSMEELFASAAWALKYGGNFYLVHRPERFAELCACAAKNRLEPKRVCLLRHHPGALPNLILIQCQKGAKTGLLWEEAYLHEPDGSPSDYYRSLYHI